jgi:hypothetical protein
LGKKNWLERLLTPDADRPERRPVENFAAYRWAGSEVKHEPVRDISSTGVYIHTEERWPVGMLLAFILQKEGPLDPLPERRITAHARVVRHGQHGVALSFVIPADTDAHKWKSALDAQLALTPPKDMLDLVRIAEAFAFLSRICPDGSEVIGELLRGRLSSNKVQNAINIIHGAESALALGPQTEKQRIHPVLLVRVLEVATATEEDWFQQLWGGLLVCSFSADGKDESNLKYIDLFSQMTSVPARIFTVVNAIASKYLTPSGTLAAKPLACKVQELTTAIGSRGVQLDRDLDRLAAIGLIERRGADSPTLLPTQEILVTPSTLGLELFARCNGHQGPARDFYTLEPVATRAPAK